MILLKKENWINILKKLLTKNKFKGVSYERRKKRMFVLSNY